MPARGPGMRAALRSIPGDVATQRLLECMFARRDAAWWQVIGQCVVRVGHSRLERGRLRIACATCAELVWTPLEVPDPECWECSREFHPGYGHPCPSFPLSEYQYHGGYPIEAGQGELEP